MTDAQRHFFNAGHLLWRWAVPVFFMITGALLLNPRRNIKYKECIGKYCKRIFLVLMFFAVPFAALIQLSNGVRDLSLIWKSVIAIFIGQSFAHLWYLYALIGIYLLIPILKAFVENSDKHELTYTLGVMFLFNFIVPTMERITNASIAFLIPIGYSIFYVLAGYYLMYYVKVKGEAWINIVIGVISVMLIIFSYMDFIPKEWTYYDNPLIAVEAWLIFIAFKNIKERDNIVKIWKLDRLCFGVYLIHPIFIHFTYRFLKITPFSVENGYIITTIGFWIMFTIISFIGSMLLNKIKLLKKYML